MPNFTDWNMYVISGWLALSCLIDISCQRIYPRYWSEQCVGVTEIIVVVVVVVVVETVISTCSRRERRQHRV